MERKATQPITGDLETTGIDPPGGMTETGTGTAPAAVGTEMTGEKTTTQHLVRLPVCLPSTQMGVLN